MKTLPPGVTRYASSPEFADGRVPENLLRSHRTKADTWARIVVLEGLLIKSCPAVQYGPARSINVYLTSCYSDDRKHCVSQADQGYPLASANMWCI